MPFENEAGARMYNRQVVIGCTEQRGDAWWRRDPELGQEDSHYPGLIPLADVTRRVFNWEPQRAGVAYLVPAPEWMPGYQHVVIDHVRYRVIPSQAGRVGVLHGTSDYDLGVFSGGAMHPPYQVTLIREAERLMGTTLGISSAGCLAEGQRAWVEFSLLETMHDPKSGLDYRPNLLKADSMDGSISLTTALTINATVCMNTLNWNLAEASKSGYIFRRKHTSGIVTGDLRDERQALGLLEQIDATFLEGVHTLLATPVSEKQVIEVMDIILPLPDESKKRGYTMQEARREQWLDTYNTDPACEPYKGTAWGLYQADNTDRTWNAPLRGNARVERNRWKDITGATAAGDKAFVKALELVLA